MHEYCSCFPQILFLFFLSTVSSFVHVHPMQVSNIKLQVHNDPSSSFAKAKTYNRYRITPLCCSLPLLATRSLRINAFVSSFETMGGRRGGRGALSLGMKTGKTEEPNELSASSTQNGAKAVSAWELLVPTDGSLLLRAATCIALVLVRRVVPPNPIPSIIPPAIPSSAPPGSTDSTFLC